MSMPLWALIAGLVVSVLGVGASVYGQHRSNETNIQLNRENNELQQELAGQANQWNIEQWNRENDYNNPSFQVARLAGANLNPAMIYGNGNLVNSAAASPQATMANTQAARVQNPLEHLSQFDPLTVAQIANLDAQTSKTRSEIPFIDKQVSLINQQIEESKANVMLIKESSLAKHEDFVRQLNENNFFMESWPLRIDEINANSAMAKQHAKKYGEELSNQIELTKQQIVNLQTSKEVDEKTKEVLGSQKDLLDKQASLIDNNIRLIEKYGDAKELVGLITQSLASLSDVGKTVANLISARTGRIEVNQKYN